MSGSEIFAPQCPAQPLFDTRHAQKNPNSSLNPMKRYAISYKNI